MKTLLTQCSYQLSKINNQQFRLILVLISLSLLVIGAAAPEVGGMSPR